MGRCVRLYLYRFRQAAEETVQSKIGRPVRRIGSEGVLCHAKGRFHISP